MKIRLLKTVRGSPDGVTIHLYEIDTEHDLSKTAREEDLAQAFVREGWAKEVSITVPLELRDLGAAPENKAIVPDDNKGRRRR